MLTELVFSTTAPPISIHGWGRALEYPPEAEDLTPQLGLITERAEPLGAKHVLWQRFANDRTPAGRFRCKVFHSTGCPTPHQINNDRCDGVVLYRKGAAAAVTTRDCPVLTLYSLNGGPAAVLHCSRSSLQDFDMQNPRGRSVVINTLTLLHKMSRDPSSVRGVLSMGIASQHFHNDRYPSVIEGIRKMWGSEVVGESEKGPTIDLVALVRAQVAMFGILPEQIEHDGLDTFMDERLGSVRAGRAGHNLTIVTYLPDR